jgi:hypothetical protein
LGQGSPDSQTPSVVFPSIHPPGSKAIHRDGPLQGGRIIEQQTSHRDCRAAFTGRPRSSMIP